MAVADVIGRKLIGKNAKTQAEMNVFFQGADWNLAERYTDMVRTINDSLERLGSNSSL